MFVLLFTISITLFPLAPLVVVYYSGMDLKSVTFSFRFG